ncbi:prepilin-type N-terminal cleavage/methylation domain-containing protein [Natranaerovirga hydrolytica]|uniref:Prepilin-type N-terminal cleavage/methylation domain-containing protein n=1 Tax=Natranaerovirga hydrolytica TaxID=680378 RepID=A0A4V6NFI9_9FIRM|nr:prepilin-type N-terminal cleavage/methylation domain-containing protein [Natranaerovirga hydrolytica]TCK98691.1 prepilin-type N-terminal cleavage/methylation domain-containing protein [Natranaerovirga hydrolytica]
MYKKYVNNPQGVTLIEIILVIAIMGLIAVLAYPMLTLSHRVFSTQLEESFERNDVRNASTYLSNDIRYSKTEPTVSEGEYGQILEVMNQEGEAVKYYINSNNRLVRQVNEGAELEFIEIEDVAFELSNNDNLVQVKLVKSNEKDLYTLDRISRWETRVQLGTDPIVDFIKSMDAHIVTDNLYIEGSGKIIEQEDGTVIVKNPLSVGEGTLIDVSDIYILKGLTARKSAIVGSKTNNGNIYIEGNVENYTQLNGNVYIDGDLEQYDDEIGNEAFVNGNLKLNWGTENLSNVRYTGNLTKPDYINAPVIKDLSVANLFPIDVPTIDPPYMPTLRHEDWYDDNGYSSDYLDPFGDNNNYKYFGPTLTLPSHGSYRDVTIVSQGDITIGGAADVKGMLFAPNGRVTVSAGSSFEGIIIAKDVTVSGGAEAIATAGVIFSLDGEVRIVGGTEFTGAVYAKEVYVSGDSTFNIVRLDNEIFDTMDDLPFQTEE